jgi:hypothetical protein
VEGGHGFKRMIQDGGMTFVCGEAVNILTEERQRKFNGGIVLKGLTVRLVSTYTGFSKS